MMPHVRLAVDVFLDRYMTADFVYFDDLQQLSVSIRKSAAQILGSNESDIAMFPNSASAFSAIMMGYPFKKGDQVILVDGDFPSVTLPFSSLRKDLGVDIVVLEQRAFYQDPIGVLAAAMTDRTRCFVSSFVGYMSGVSIPLETISVLCKGRGVHFFVDATQGAGVLPIEVAQWGLDAVIVSPYKWLQAPIGVAIGAISAELRAILAPISAGWLSTEAPKQMITMDAPFSRTASSFEPGGRAILSMVGLEASLRYFLETGLESIRETTYNLRRLLQDAFKERGFELYCDPLETERSGIISIKVTPDLDGLFEALLAKGYRTTLRLGVLRFSVYYMHTETDVMQLISEIDGFLSSK